MLLKAARSSCLSGVLFFRQKGEKHRTILTAFPWCCWRDNCLNFYTLEMSHRNALCSQTPPEGTDRVYVLPTRYCYLYWSLHLHFFLWGLSQVVPRTDGSTFSPEKDNVSQSFSNSCLWLRHFCLPHGSIMLIKIKGKMLHESFRTKRIWGGALIK